MSEILHNPIRGNTVKIKKRITRATFEKNPTYAEEYEYNTANDADYNESYMILTHKERGKEEGLLIKEKEWVPTTND